ncbi:MAG: VWA domain-containing protein, partial [Candidatus Binatia bacterium]
MIRRGAIFLAFMAFAFSAAALCGFNFASAQENSEKKEVKAAPTPTPSDEDEIVKVDTDAVNVLFTAQDKNRRLLTSLKPEDVRILENGEPQQIEAFNRQVDLPLSLAILIDVSLSQERTLPEEKEAAISFLENVIRPTKDEVSVVSFTGESTLEQGMTNNLTRLRRAVDKVEVVRPT